MLAAAVAFSVASVCASGLVALKWVLAHRAQSFEHKPVADLQRKLSELEDKILSGAMRR